MMKVRGLGFASLHTVEEALAILSDHIKPVQEVELINTRDAIDRKLAEDIHATRDQPGFRRAAMDGFAIKAEDSYGVSETNPLQLRIVGVVEIGDLDSPSIKSGEALRISTGAPLPDEATGVIKIEDTEVLGDTVEIYNAVAKGKNIADKDEDVQKGQLILPKNTLLKPWDIAMLESLSITKIKVFRKPRIATLSTGNELIPSTEPLQRGQVVDSNRPAINSWVKKLGGDIVVSQQCDDEYEIIKQNILQMANITDMIITSGGTSVGSKDYLPEVIDEIGEVWVHGIAIRPGKPVVIGHVKKDDKTTLIIALPGYPLAAFLNFHLFVSYILGKWTGQKDFLSDKKIVRLADKIASKVGTHDFVRLRQVENGAEVIRITGAGILSSLVKADYLLEIPTDIEGYNAGDEVEVYVLR